jgi:1-acyl-sn-glycerol-3-phosphate acyltransferase
VARKQGPTLTDRTVRRAASIAGTWLYRSIEVTRIDQPPKGPVLLVANHGGGAADPLVLVHATTRMPRFVARDVIWKFPVTRQVMQGVKAIPIHRREDGAAKMDGNAAAFEEVVQSLADGELVAIFPEGDSIDAPRVDHVRTGAARMLLEAKQQGVGGIRIMPVGLHYRDKGSLRSAVYVEIGRLLDLDALLAELGATDPGPQDRELVQQVTARIAAALADVSPGFRDWDTAHDLETASAIALRTIEGDHPGTEVETYAHVAQVARVLAAADDDRLETLRATLKEYEDDLAGLGLDDDDVAGHDRLEGRVAQGVVQAAVMAPLAVATLPANAPGILATAAVARLPVAPPTMATLKPVAAIVTFPAGWLWFALRGHQRDPARVVGRLVLAQAGLVGTLVVADRATSLVRGGRAAWKSRKLPSEQLLEHRRALVAAVVEAAEAGWAEFAAQGVEPPIPRNAVMHRQEYR